MLTRANAYLIGLCLIISFSGCEQLIAPPEKPLPTSHSWSDPDEVPRPEPTPEPEPEPTPPPAPVVPSLTVPNIIWQERIATPVNSQAARGIGFRLAFVVEKNPDQLPLRVMLKDRTENVLPLEPRLSDNQGLVEYFAAGAKDNFGPYRVAVYYFDKDQDEWIICTGWAAIKL